MIVFLFLLFFSISGFGAAIYANKDVYVIFTSATFGEGTTFTAVICCLFAIKLKIDKFS